MDFLYIKDQFGMAIIPNLIITDDQSGTLKQGLEKMVLYHIKYYFLFYVLFFVYFSFLDPIITFSISLYF